MASSQNAVLPHVLQIFFILLEPGCEQGLDAEVVDTRQQEEHNEIALHVRQ